MKIIYVDKKMKVIGRRNTDKRQMDWSGGISILITKAELTAWLGPTIWDVSDCERPPALKMRGGKFRTGRQLILRGIIKEDSFFREDNGKDKNRFINKKIDIFNKKVKKKIYTISALKQKGLETVKRILINHVH